METRKKEFTPKTSEELLLELADLDPKPFDNMSPDNANEIAKLFVAGQTDDFGGLTYSRLDSIDFEERQAKYDVVEAEILSHPKINPNTHRYYQTYINDCRQMDKLMQTARDYRRSQDPQAKAGSRATYEALNRELYGDPQPTVARAMFKELMEDSADIDHPTIQKLRHEFHDLLSPLLGTETAENIKVAPSVELVEYINGVVQTVFAPVTKIVDELISKNNPNNIINNEDKVDADGTAKMFEVILADVFSSSGWRVERRDIPSVNVIAAEKVVAVPIESLPKRPDQARGLAVHESVHMLRAMMGSQMELIPLQLGMPGYLDPEEGIAGIAEKAVRNIPKVRTGYQHYITSVLVRSGLPPRQIHEIMWRYTAIDHYQEKPETVDDKWLDKQRLGAAKYIIRGIRGSGDQSWQTTLSYYEGSLKMWRYIEQYQGDFDMMMLLFTGKINPTDIEHRRAVWSSK